MIDLTALLIVFGSLLTGAVFIGLPVGIIVGRRRAWDEIDTADILESEEIS